MDAEQVYTNADDFNKEVARLCNEHDVGLPKISGDDLYKIYLNLQRLSPKSLHPIVRVFADQKKLYLG